jgi:AcrR family transcriptional regulator
MRIKRQALTASVSQRRIYRPGDERAQEILEAALELFAEHGFATTVQAIADRVGVTQPLIHRYFPTKATLFEMIREQLLHDHWNAQWRRMLTDRSRPLPERLNGFYETYLPIVYRRVWYRGFLHVAVQDGTFAQIYLKKVERDLLGTMLQETRHHLGLPERSDVAFHERELELTWGMHSTFVYIGMRKFIYNLPLPDDLASVIRDQTAGYLLAAERIMTELVRRQPGPRRTPQTGTAGEAVR